MHAEKQLNADTSLQHEMKLKMGSTGASWWTISYNVAIECETEMGGKKWQEIKQGQGHLRRRYLG